MENEGMSFNASCICCGQGIKGSYYKFNEHLCCSVCRPQLEREISWEGNPVKSVVFGLIGAVISAVIWALVVIWSGWQVGIIAIIVGMVVGNMVRAGGPGGKKYQFIAVALIFLSLSWATTGIVMQQVYAYSLEMHRKQVSAASAADGSVNPANFPAPSIHWVRLATEFLSSSPKIYVLTLGDDPASILFLLIALYEGWVINSRRKVIVQGPFSLGDEEINFDTAEESES